MNDAAVETPAPEGVSETPADLSEDQALDQAYDAIQAQEDGEPDPAPEAEEAPEEAAEQEGEPEAEAESAEAPEVEVPSDLPGAVKEHWAQIPEAAREGLLKSHRELAQKVSDAARKSRALDPIMGAVQQAAKEIPGFANYTPEQVAQQVLNLSRAGQMLSKDPATTLRQLARDHNVDLAKLAGGQPNEAQNIMGQMQREIASLREQLASQPDQVNNIIHQRQVASEVETFAGSQPHWAEVEQHLPTVIPVAQAKLGDSASPSAVLEAAYKMAVEQFVPNARATDTKAGDEPAATDPERAKAVLRAKSVNVQGKPGGKSRPLTEDEALEQAWDRLNAS